MSNYYRLGLFGSHGYPDEDYFYRYMKEYELTTGRPGCLVVGGSKDFMEIVKQYANDYHLDVYCHKPVYNDLPANQKYRAPLLRNSAIVDQTDKMIIFENNARVTKDIVKKAKQKLLKPTLIHDNDVVQQL